MSQCLQANLTAELTDNAGWELLIKPAENLGYSDMATEFQTALEHEGAFTERSHLVIGECSG